jgi:hypothetical protein
MRAASERRPCRSDSVTSSTRMRFSVHTAALLSIISTILLTDCETAGSAPVAATTATIANSAHPDLPANYRKQIADFTPTQRGDMPGLFPHAFPKGILKGGAEIADPNRKLGLGGMEDVVCVRFGGSSG